MMNNNLFCYATSELSQDAFICYLAAFALDEVECEPALKKCAKDLLHIFVEEIDSGAVVLEQVQRQVGHIDVLLTAKYNDKIYKIIVEDKTFTSEHDNQLIRYINDLATTDESVKIHGVYYKTGFQGDLSYVKGANYTIVTQETMLEFVAPYIPHISNQIVLEYYEYWRSFQDDAEKHITLPVQDWDWKQINGCYDHLQRYIFTNHPDYWASYGYVSNPSGGFYGLWTGGDRYCIDVAGIPMELYLQYEIPSNNPSAAQLCLKLIIRAKKKTLLRQETRSFTMKNGHTVWVTSIFPGLLE